MAERLIGRDFRSEGGSSCPGLVLSLETAASLASLSAKSFPSMSAWPAIQFSDTSDLFALFRTRASLISFLKRIRR